MKSIQFNFAKQLRYIFFITLLGIIACKQEKAKTYNETTSKREIEAPNINLQEAVISGNIEAVQQHIKAGTYLNERDAFSGATPLITAITFGKKNIAKELVKAGADLSIKNNDGSTALHVAAFFCRIEEVKMLLDAGADKSVKNNFGANPRETVIGPFEEIRPYYEMLQEQLAPLGLNLDLIEIEKTRPVIAMMLQ
ncbi:ankyrin repeat domain-containing protein [Aegicerativicinus sediminis]